MRVLALETATDLVGAAVDRDGSVAERSHLGAGAHAELLAPAIEEVCALAGCALGDLDALAVDVGPGCSPGLRVGVATAKALGQALGLGVLGVSSLDVLAAGACEAAPGARSARVVAVVDARRGEVFAAAYEAGPRRRPRTAPTPAAVRTDRAERPRPRGPCAWCDDLAERRAGAGGRRRRRPLPRAAGAPAGPRRRPGPTVAAPSPAALARLAVRRLAAGAAPRPPAAVRARLPPSGRRPDQLGGAGPAADGAGPAGSRR